MHPRLPPSATCTQSDWHPLTLGDEQQGSPVVYKVFKREYKRAASDAQRCTGMTSRGVAASRRSHHQPCQQRQARLVVPRLKRALQVRPGAVVQLLWVQLHIATDGLQLCRRQAQAHRCARGGTVCQVCQLAALGTGVAGGKRSCTVGSCSGRHAGRQTVTESKSH